MVVCVLSMPAQSSTSPSEHDLEFPSGALSMECARTYISRVMVGAKMTSPSHMWVAEH